MNIIEIGKRCVGPFTGVDVWSHRGCERRFSPSSERSRAGWYNGDRRPATGDRR